MVRRLAALAVGLTLIAASAAPAAAEPVTFLPGSAGMGDPYYPLQGNGGYDVGHYDLRLRFDPDDHAVDAPRRSPRPPYRTCRASTSTSPGRRSAACW